MIDSEPPSSRSLPQAFPHTRWSVVLAATREPSPEADAALETVCQAYWCPLYAYVRRSGQSPPDAQDLTQEFFRCLLERRWLDAADREKGRLRSFLVTALKRFMAKEWRRVSAKKRGGGQSFIPVDTEFAESRYASDAGSQRAAEAVFDRQWALTLLDLTVRRLEVEFNAAGKADDFKALKSCLAAVRGSIDYGPVAVRLGLSESAARVAVHRMRKRFRELYRVEIAQTLPDGADVDEELRHLAAALSAG